MDYKTNGERAHEHHFQLNLSAMTSESPFHGAQQMDNFCPKNDYFVGWICLWDRMSHFSV